MWKEGILDIHRAQKEFFLQFLVTQDVPDKKIASLKQIQLLTKIVASMCTFGGSSYKQKISEIIANQTPI